MVDQIHISQHSGMETLTCCLSYILLCLALPAGVLAQVDSSKLKRVLGWEPSTERSMLDDIVAGSYAVPT